MGKMKDVPYGLLRVGWAGVYVTEKGSHFSN